MSVAAPQARPPGFLSDELRSPAGTIGGSLFDACLLWGSPVLAAAMVWLWVDGASLLPDRLFQASVLDLVAAIGVLTFAHLIAVAPRAYLNRTVFETNRARLTIAPMLLIPALLISPSLLAIAGVLAVFWDVHHSAMQTFGLGRIYDLKAGQGGPQLRRTDLVFNWVLYVGPIGFGAAFAVHLHEMTGLRNTPLAWIASGEGLLQANAGLVRVLAWSSWLIAIAAAFVAYHLERREGYRMPPHKLALFVSTGLASIIAWGLSPPLVAFAIVNLFHAVQYFALVWLKEGSSLSRIFGHRQPSKVTLALFLGGCGLFGVAYSLAKSTHILLAVFVACSLLHFWFDSFIWSVRRKQV